LPHPLPLTPEGASDPGKEVFGLVRGAPGLEGNADESLGRLQAFINKESFERKERRTRKGSKAVK
jgi:hypothetical protein